MLNSICCRTPRTQAKTITRLFLLITSLVLPSLLAAATSITRHAITWTFNENRSVAAGNMGQYANGDWWVVGPITITNITPLSVVSSGRTMNGTMTNPVPGQFASCGFDSEIDFYSVSKNAGRPNGSNLSSGNPLVVANGTSVLSSKSLDNITTTNYPMLSDISILTVVASAPPANSFRPPYCGTDKSHNWQTGDLDYGILQSLAPVGDAPTSLSGLASTFERPWIEISLFQAQRAWKPTNNQPSAYYGREISTKVGNALAALHLNFSNSEKEALFINIVQYGIDIYGTAVAGGTWAPNGGFNHGRKPALVFASLALGDSAMQAYANRAQHNIFQEDRQTWTVDASDVGRTLYNGDGRQRDPYTSAMIGMPEWGEKHSDTPSRDGSNWGVLYRDVNYNSSIGTAIAMRLTTGAQSLWNWSAWFNYMDRVMGVLSDPNWPYNPASIQGAPAFHRNMFDTYRGGTPSQTASPVFSPSGGTYTSTQTVTISSNTSGATIRYTLDGNTPTSSYGTIYGSPVSISSSATLKAIAYKIGLSDSTVTSAGYTIDTSDTTPPSTPTGLTASNTTATSVDLDWNASSDNVGVTEYNIYTNGSSPVSLTETSATLTGLSPATSYTFSVSALDAAQNESAQSSGVNVTTQSLAGTLISEDFSSSASNFTVESGGTWSLNNGRYVLSSPAGSSTAGVLGNLSVHNTSVSNNFNLSATMRITGTHSAWNDAAIVFGLQDTSNYYYVSLNESNDAFTKGIIKVEDGVPSELADISISVVSDTDYAVEIERDGGAITVDVNSTQVATTTDSTFSGGKVGFGSYNDGAEFDSLLVTGSSSGDTEAPITPTGLAASNITATTVDLSWNASTDNVGVTTYKIYTNGASPITVTGTSTTLTGLSQYTGYTFSVSAVDVAGNESSTSSGVSVTTADGEAPSVPTGLFASNVNGTTADLDWNASTDNIAVAGYNIYADGSYSGSTTATSVTLTGLEPETSYALTVSAYDAAGNESGQSGAANITTSDVPVLQSVVIENLTAAGTVGSVTVDSADRTSTTTVTPSTTACGYTGVDEQTLEFEITGLTLDGSGSGDDSVTFSILVESWGVTASTGTPSLSLDSPYTFSTDSTNYWGNTGSSGGGCFSSSTQAAAGEGLAFSFVDGEVSLGGTPSGSVTIELSGFDAISYDNRTSPAAVVVLKDSQASALPSPDWDQTISLGGAGTFAIGAESGGFRLTNLDLTLSIVGPSSDSTAPSTPTDLAANVISTSSVDLSWNAASDNVGVTGYKVYVNGSNPIAVMGTSTTVSGLTQNTSYTFTVSAVDAAQNESSPSSGLNVTTADGQAPSTPTGLAVGTVTANSVALSWNTASDNVGVTGYRVYTDGSNPLPVSGTSTTVSSLASYSTYSFTVTAVDAAGNESTPSSEVETTTLDNVAPSAPTGLSVDTITTTSVTLSWNAASDNVGVTGYKVYTDSANPVSVTGTQATVTELAQNTSYTFTVTAEDAAANESSPSSGVSATTLTSFTTQTIVVSNLTASGGVTAVTVNSTDETSATTITPSTTACGYSGANGQTVEFEITGLTIDGSGTGDDSVTFSIMIEAWGGQVEASTPSITLSTPYTISTNSTVYWGNTGPSGASCSDSLTCVNDDEGISFRFVEGSVSFGGGGPSAIVSLVGFDAIGYDGRSTSPIPVVVMDIDGQVSELSGAQWDQTINLNGAEEFAIGAEEGYFRLGNLDFTIEVTAP